MTVRDSDTLTCWLRSMGIKGHEHYATKLEDAELEIADVPYLTEDALRDIGVKVRGGL